MKPHPRIRKTIKWGGAAVTVLLMVAWIGSGWWALIWIQPHTVMAAHSGLFEVDTWGGTHDPGIQGWQFGLSTSRPRWSNEFGHVPVYKGAQTRFPLWFPSILCAAATAAAWHLDRIARRRARTSHCPKCNYDRAGIAGDAKCPECGAMPLTPKA